MKISFFCEIRNVLFKSLCIRQFLYWFPGKLLFTSFFLYTNIRSVLDGHNFAHFGQMCCFVDQRRRRLIFGQMASVCHTYHMVGSHFRGGCNHKLHLGNPGTYRFVFYENPSARVARNCIMHIRGHLCQPRTKVFFKRLNLTNAYFKI